MRGEIVDKKRVIMLADCQSFYASVEKAAHPEFRNKPLVVAGDPERRSGIILAACPLAKQFGVTTAETLREALLKCPDLVVIKPRMQEYIHVSLHITKILQSFSDLVEPYSIDEQFIDITASQRLFGSPITIAKAIQDKVMSETGVYTRVGLGPNKILAKMACDNYAKKNREGIFNLHKEDLASTLWTLPVKNMFGVGSKMKHHLNRLGIYTIGDLAKTPVERLQKKWGVNGIVLWQTANGIDYSPVSPNTHDGQKAIGHQMTLPRDYRCKEEIDVILLELSEEVCMRSRMKGYQGWVISVGCSGADFDAPTGFYRQRKLDEPTNITNVVYKAARNLFDQYWNRLPVRRLGVTLSELVSDQEYQLSLFIEQEKFRVLEKTTDRLKQKYGNPVIVRAASLTEAGQAMERSRKIGGHYK
jgi:DNA polymerase-4